MAAAGGVHAVRWWLPAVLPLLVGAAGCRQALTAVFDIPPPRPAAADATRRRLDPVPVEAPADTARPPIERTLFPDSARALLPRDHAGNIDWVAALRSGAISPRRVLPGRAAPATGFLFAFDFLFPGPDTTFDAAFPHSVHTEWVACQQCHPRIFRYRGAPITMADVFQGRYCGECHGKVSFPVLTGCERCHQRLVMPANRAQPEFLGTLTLHRALPDSGTAAGMNTEALPAATFPHWVHRIRYRCSACHMELFEPRNGANRVTMRDIADGRRCGACHDGRNAFPATVGTCQRCHVARADAAAGG